MPLHPVQDWGEEVLGCEESAEAESEVGERFWFPRPLRDLLESASLDHPFLRALRSVSSHHTRLDLANSCLVHHGLKRRRALSHGFSHLLKDRLLRLQLLLLALQSMLHRHTFRHFVSICLAWRGWDGGGHVAYPSRHALLHQLEADPPRCQVLDCLFPRLDLALCVLPRGRRKEAQDCLFEELLRQLVALSSTRPAGQSWGPCARWL